MGIEGGFVVILMVISAPLMVYGVEHVVGDSSGWNLNVNYDSWASSQTFRVGDTLLFRYGGNHKVDIVNETDYTNCNTGNALRTFQDGNTTIALTVVGKMYFICPYSNHCPQGQKLAVDVVAPNGTPVPVPVPPSTTTPSRASNLMCNVNMNLMLGLWLILLFKFGLMG